MDDLIKRLRRCSAGLDGYETDQGDYGVLNEAAAALAEAQAEIARLREALAEWQVAGKYADDQLRREGDG